MFGWFEEYEQRQNHEAFDRGYKEGLEAGLADEIFHGIGDAVTSVVPGETDKHKAYEAGFKKGLQDRWRVRMEGKRKDLCRKRV